MTEPRGLDLLRRQRWRRRASSSLEQQLLDNDEVGGDHAEEACSLLLADARLPPSLRLPPCHRRIDTPFIHPALEYEILPVELLDDINHSNNNNCSNNHDCLLHLQQVAAAQEEERIRQYEEDCTGSTRRHSKSKSIKLFFSFIFLILFGSANSVALKLQAIPMYNYPNFLILFVNFMYIPICFAYILPVARYGWFNQAIPPVEHWNISISHHRPFIIMGFLDYIASCMQILSAVYLPGPLVVLLPQAAIPMSMFLSKWLLHERFHHCQVIGAVIVILGLLVVLEPVVTQRLAPDYYCQALNMENDCSICKVENTQNSCLSHVFIDDNDDDDDALSVLQQQWRKSTSSSGMEDESNDDDNNNNNLLCDWVPFEEASRQEEFLMFVWSLVLIASCIPLTLSTVYKQMALGNYDNSNDNIRQGQQHRRPMDPIFLNGWISVYQFIFSLPLAIPAGLVSSPPVLPADLMQNLWNGLRCYAVGMSFVDTGCHVDDLCSSSSSSTTTAASHHYYGGGSATFYVNLSLVINVGYTIAMILVVKYGSTALLFLALTVMIPISHLTFSLPFLPLATTTLHPSDIVGLIVIVAGIILYRFSDGMTTCSFCKDDDDDNHDNDVVDDVDDAVNNRGTDAANSEPATVGVDHDGVVLENDVNINNNNGQVGGEGKEDALLLLIQPLRRTGDV